MKANAEFVRMADFHVDAPAGSNNNNYANVDFIVDIAKRTKVQAVWAGWGHASENPRLPDSLDAAGIVFMGPPGLAMRSLGDKISSTIVAQSADVPCMPWSGTGLTVDANSTDATGALVVPDSIYQQGCVKTAEQCMAAAVKIGFPVMIKASEGGGGKGIRKVTDAELLPGLFRQVQTEVPGSPIFVMKLASGARHLEVQLLADNYGNCIALFGRDCSVQRRHQKIIEEAPAAVADIRIFDEMERAAVRLGKLVGYVSTGTIEYLYNETDGSFQFLELNPRLQVEHPCSEMVTGVNLPAAQLAIAMGLPLYQISSIRTLYGFSKFGKDVIDFNKVKIGCTSEELGAGFIEKPTPAGHVIACRITAENPDEGFKPSSGTVEELIFRSSLDVWGYFSVSPSGSLHEYADSQFGHCFAWGETREHARRAMVMALKELSIRGDFRTTVEYLIKLLETERFRINGYNTEWLDGLILDKMQAERPDTMVAVTCGAIHIVDVEIEKRLAEFAHSLSRGQVLPRELTEQSADLSIIYDHNKYDVTAARLSPARYSLVLNGQFIEVDLHRLSDGGSLVRLNGESVVVYMKEEVERYRLVVGGRTCIFDKENDPTLMRTVSAGKLIRYLVDDGGHVNKGEAYCEVEVMKMVMSLYASASGKLTHALTGGSILEAGDLLGTLVLDDPNQVQRPTQFQSSFPNVSSAEQLPIGNDLQQLRGIVSELTSMLHGYGLPEPFFAVRIKTYVDRMITLCNNKHIPVMHCREVLSALGGRLPSGTADECEALLAGYERSITSLLSKFPVQRIANIIDSHAANLDASEQDAWFLVTAPLQEVINNYRFGMKGYLVQLVQGLVHEYLTVENHYASHRSFESVTQSMRKDHKDDVMPLVKIIMSHSRISTKNAVMKCVLDKFFHSKASPFYLSTATTGTPVKAGSSNDSMLIEGLKALAQLTQGASSAVALQARQILIKQNLPSYERRRNKIEAIFIEAAESQSSESIGNLVNDYSAVFDVLSDFFYHSNPMVQQSAMEVYVRRAHVGYVLEEVQPTELGNGRSMVSFTFHLPSGELITDEDAPTALSQSCVTNSGVLESTINEDEEGGDETPSSARGGLKRMPKVGLGLSPGSEQAAKAARVFSIGDLGAYERANTVDNPPQRQRPGLVQTAVPTTIVRLGAMAAFATLDEAASSFNKLIAPFKVGGAAKAGDEPANVLNIAISSEGLSDDDKCIEAIGAFIDTVRGDLVAHSVRRISFCVVEYGAFPKQFTFRERLDYAEDSLFRHVDPALAFKLEMFRMSNYDIVRYPCQQHRLHVYYCTEKTAPGRKITDRRFFVRTVMRQEGYTEDFVYSVGESHLIEALDELEMAVQDKNFLPTDCNHIFMNVAPLMIMDPMKFAQSLITMIMRFKKRLWKLRVNEAEIRATFKGIGAGGQDQSVRFVISNESGYYMNVAIYNEVAGESDNAPMYQSFDTKKPGPLHNRSCSEPYAVKDDSQVKRYKAQKLGSTYVYDYIDLMRECIGRRWQALVDKVPDTVVPTNVLDCTEMVLTDKDELVEVSLKTEDLPRLGMVAWKITVFPPEMPLGRDLIMISNDITHLIGSFGPREDMVFLRASQLARKLKIPRIYVSVNSGARIGLATEVMNKFQAAWENPEMPWKGFKYLYLTPDDYRSLADAGAVKAEAVSEDGETRYKITDVIGLEHGLGVESLRGSGMIAGETATAYDETFTATLVSCRSVGIGAYLVRLGQRAVQCENSHIILTGAGALNKVLGKEVYTSNLQLGGPQIMYNNGVSHMMCRDDFEGMNSLVHWISYLPPTGQALPFSQIRHTISLNNSIFTHDPVDRSVDFVPGISGSYDPRQLIIGNEDTPGLFDRGSFTEILGGWANTVIAGRARLGGIAVGVVAVETRPVEVLIPADPANMDTEASVRHDAGQVWYPNSAFKTAQVINDVNRERLPLFILANWRGFSGGMRDMYDEVLKFGAMIVDALTKFKQPIFIYIPPKCELRGGAWVVVDPSINSEMMEMYADADSRGGVLEAEGTVEIKFRKPAVIAAMLRMDPTFAKLRADADAAPAGDHKQELEAAAQARYARLAPMYHQVAVAFADLHDTPGRMKAKNVISDVLEFKSARKFFYWRLRRRVYENVLKAKVMQASPGISTSSLDFVFRRWFFTARGSKEAYLWDDNMEVANWYGSQIDDYGTLAADSPISMYIENFRLENAVEQARKLGAESSESAYSCALALLDFMSPEQRAAIAEAIAGNRM